MSTRTGLSNQMLGKTVEPVVGLGHIWKLDPNASGDQYATVEAAFQSENHVKLLLRGPMGDMQEVFATHVKVRNVT